MSFFLTSTPVVNGTFAACYTVRTQKVRVFGERARRRVRIGKGFPKSLRGVEVE